MTFIDDIKVCQVGYLSDAPKAAFLTNVSAEDAYIVDSAAGNIVLTVPIGAPSYDANSGDSISNIVFDNLSKPGTYHITIPGVGRSCDFKIGNDVFDWPYRTAMRSFLGQRCGMDASLAPDFPEYRYPACHTALANFDSSSGKLGEIDVSGGWHDAGDYGRYIVNSGITTATLLWAWELYGDKLVKHGLDIPESGGALPDFLAEVKYNTDWMLKLQDSTDGGVWHKATTPDFCGFIMPEADNQMPVVVIGTENPPHKVTTATADFVAVCACAARVFREFDPVYAGRCLRAAKHAWEWLVSTPDNIYENPPHIKTGGYGDSDASDERLWAASELLRTTGAEVYHEYFKTNYVKWNPPIHAEKPQTWRSVSNMAMFTYLLNEDGDPDIRKQILDSAIVAADEIVLRMISDGYHNPMLAKDYVWGSNSEILNYAMMLLITFELYHKAEYRTAALESLHYIFGRNTFNTSFVTHVGSRWPMNPHHRPSGADGITQPWPGLLVGGPNARGQEKPATHWKDEESEYSLNETAINWQAPLIFVLAAAISC